MSRSFAEKANQVGSWIERQVDAVAAIGIGMQGSLEEQLSRLSEYEEAVYQFKPHHEELERINQQIQESFVFENRYTQYTMETLRVGWEQSVTSVNRTINEVENQILLNSIKDLLLWDSNGFKPTEPPLTLHYSISELYQFVHSPLSLQGYQQYETI